LRVCCVAVAFPGLVASRGSPFRCNVSACVLCDGKGGRLMCYQPFSRVEATNAIMARRIGSGSVGQASLRRARSGSSSSLCANRRTNGDSTGCEALSPIDLRRGVKIFWFSLSRFESWPGSFESSALICPQSLSSLIAARSYTGCDRRRDRCRDMGRRSSGSSVSLLA
jgi:hypothetical protein